MESNNRVLSCIQPTGTLHLGNYLGAIKNWASLQDKYECVFGVVDLHAMTMPYNPQELRKNTVEMVIELMACGIDPERSVLFIQSLVPEHTELAWVFNCVTSYGQLSRMTQFKDKSQQLESGSSDNFVSAGLFTYPILQAADILVYRAGHVPVGKDQVQHLELTRNIAVRFNHQFGDFFPEPQPLLTEVPKLMSLADPTNKMSKSLGPKHFISMFEEDNAIRKKVRSAVTDTGGITDGAISPGVENLFTLLKASGKEDVLKGFQDDHASGNLRYSDLKDAVGDALVEMIAPIRMKKEALMSDKKKVEEMIQEQSLKARTLAADTMRRVRKRTGLHAQPYINFSEINAD